MIDGMDKLLFFCELVEEEIIDDDCDPRLLDISAELIVTISGGGGTSSLVSLSLVLCL